MESLERTSSLKLSCRRCPLHTVAKGFVVLLSITVVISHAEISCPFCPNCTEALPVSCCPKGFYWDGNFTEIANTDALKTPLQQFIGSIPNVTSSPDPNCMPCSVAIEGCDVCKRRGLENVTCDGCSNTGLSLIDNRCQRLTNSITSLVLIILASIFAAIFILVGVIVCITRFHWSTQDEKPPALPTVSQLDWPPTKASQDVNAGRKSSVLRYLRTLNSTTGGSENDGRPRIPSVHYQSNSQLHAAEEQSTVEDNRRQMKPKAPLPVTSGEDTENMSCFIVDDQENVYSNTACGTSATSSLMRANRIQGASNVAVTDSPGPEEEYANFRELTLRRNNDVFQDEDDSREVYANLMM